MALYRRRFFKAQRKDDVRGMEAAARCFWSRWKATVDLLNDPGSILSEGLPLGMADTLRREGLI